MPVKFPVESFLFPNADNWTNRDAIADAMSLLVIAREVRCTLDEDNDLWSVVAFVEYPDLGMHGFHMLIPNHPELFNIAATDLLSRITTDMEQILGGSFSDAN